MCGEAGVGKSRLIEEYLARADAGRTAVGGCLELGADGVPFAPFTTLLRHLAREEGAPPSAAHSRELARLLPELGRAPEGADDGRARLFESVLTFLEERSRPGGLLVVVEDLHWADASTRDLLVFLLRNLGDVPVHLLVSVRTDDIHRTHPLRGLLPELERLPRVGRLDVGPLDRDAVAAQASALRGGALDPAALDLLLERTGGNPLFVESFLHSQDPTGGPIPEGPRGLLLATVERLPDTTRRVLGLAATAGTGSTTPSWPPSPSGPGSPRSSSTTHCAAPPTPGYCAPPTTATPSGTHSSRRPSTRTCSPASASGPTAATPRPSRRGCRACPPPTPPSSSPTTPTPPATSPSP
ncbi:AAA family ATPase [Nocardiopsis sp. ARC36]